MTPDSRAKEEAMSEEIKLRHDGLCPCGAVVPCEEETCDEPPGHELDCPECWEAIRKKPDPFDLACERRFD